MLAVATVVALLLGASAVDTKGDQCMTGACGPQSQHLEMHSDELEEDLLGDVNLLQTRVLSVDGEVGGKHEVLPDLPPLPAAEESRNVMRIICPFLSTLVNEGVLDGSKTSFTKEELKAITIQAGLSEASAEFHSLGNFANNPSGQQDIFAMEGAANEHVTSTGIHDCPTLYYNCVTSAGVQSCQNFTLDCELPNKPLFEQFWKDVDTNGDNWMTRAELEAYSRVHSGKEFPPPAFIVDVNPIARGSIFGGHDALLTIFGEGRGEDLKISKEDFFRISILRKFPEGYVFPPPSA